MANPHSDAVLPKPVIYATLVVLLLFFLAPIYVMVVTSLKSMPEIRDGALFALPKDASFDHWARAWSGACSGRVCDGLRPGFATSVAITIPKVALTILLAAITGYVLSFWRFRFCGLFFSIMLLGAFIPQQIFVFPIVRLTSSLDLFGTMPGLILVHICFGLPFITLLFRNFFASVPVEIIHAARVDGAGFWSVFFWVLMPISTPIIITAIILDITWTWNEYLWSLVFSGRDMQPLMILLNNIVGSEQGAIEYNVNMAATLLAAIVPVIIYFVSGRYFVRGIVDGSLGN